MKSFRHQSRPKKNSLVAGRKAVINAIQSGQQFDKIFLDTRAQGPEISQIQKLASQHTIPVSYVPTVKLNGFNVSNHDGCIAQISKVQYQNLQDIISFVTDSGQSPLFLMLDGITDIRNIGGIARTAFCMGVHALIIPDKGVGALNEDAILTSAGALEKIPVCRVNSLMKAVDELHLNGIKVFATDTDAATDVSDCNFKEPCAIIMGSEEKGVFPALVKICDGNIMIPMSGEFESLNVSVATGIILFETMKQRNPKTP